MMSAGPGALTDAELLGLLLDRGMENVDAVSVARRILEEARGLLELSTEEPARLLRRGMGVARAARLLACFEVGRRIARGDSRARSTVTGPADAARILSPHLRRRMRERFVLLPLDSKGRAGTLRSVSVGSLTASIVHPREVFREAIAASAASIIVAHNHPSGDPTPSPEDLAVTRKLQAASELLGIPLLDHLVIGDGSYVSILGACQEAEFGSANSSISAVSYESCNRRELERL